MKEKIIQVFLKKEGNEKALFFTNKIKYKAIIIINYFAFLRIRQTFKIKSKKIIRDKKLIYIKGSKDRKYILQYIF